MDSRPIGVFDSGVGGLTVVKELMKQLPNESIVYFGDTARVPYGNKSKETVIKFSIENILFLLKQRVKLIVVACNTSSSLALPKIKRHFRIPLIGVILPGVKDALRNTVNKRVGVIGTRATINSGAYEREIKDLDPSIRVFSKSCPLFVPLVEEAMLNGKFTSEVIRMYTAPLKNLKVDTLILGCTHYPLLKKAIAKVMGKNVTLVDSAQQVAREVKEELHKAGLFSDGKNKKHVFYVTDEPSAFINTARLFLGKSLGKVRRANPV